MTGAPSRPQRQVRLPLHIIDLIADELRSNSGEHVDLRPRSYAVLRLLAENAAVTRITRPPGFISPGQI